VALLAASLSTLGCGRFVRIGVGPNVDTFGNAGFDVKLSVALGMATDNDGGFVEGTLGGGLADEGKPLLVGGTGLSGLYRGKYFGIQAGGVFSNRLLYGDDDTLKLYGLGGYAMPFGVLWRDTVRGSFFKGRHVLMLGLPLQGEHLWGPGDTDRGVFSFPVALQWTTSNVH